MRMQAVFSLGDFKGISADNVCKIAALFCAERELTI